MGDILSASDNAAVGNIKIGTDKERRFAEVALKTTANRFYGICEALRTVYDLIYDHPDNKRKEEIIKILIDAMVMAKKINERLIYYHTTYADRTGNAGKNIPKITGASEKKQIRWEREQV